MDSFQHKPLTLHLDGLPKVSTSLLHHSLLLSQREHIIFDFVTAQPLLSKNNLCYSSLPFFSAALLLPLNQEHSLDLRSCLVQCSLHFVACISTHSSFYFPQSQFWIFFQSFSLWTFSLSILFLYSLFLFICNLSNWFSFLSRAVLSDGLCFIPKDSQIFNDLVFIYVSGICRQKL